MQDDKKRLPLRPHGNWFAYWSNSKLWINQNYINGELVGLYTWYNHDGVLKDKRYYAR